MNCVARAGQLGSEAYRSRRSIDIGRSAHFMSQLPRWLVVCAASTAFMSADA
jgi:hypothetical protein